MRRGERGEGRGERGEGRGERGERGEGERGGGEGRGERGEGRGERGEGREGLLCVVFSVTYKESDELVESGVWCPHGLHHVLAKQLTI